MDLENNLFFLKAAQLQKETSGKHVYDRQKKEADSSHHGSIGVISLVSAAGLAYPDMKKLKGDQL